MGYDVLARVGAGVNPEAMHAERVDGYDPLAVADAVRRTKELLLAGKGPVLLDTITYRISGHSPSDASSYRTKEEMELWEQADSIEAFTNLLVSKKVVGKTEVEDLHAVIVDRLTKVLTLATNDEECPRVDAAFVESVMLSNTHVESFGSGEPELLQPLAENARVKAIAKKIRTAKDSEGKPVSKVKMYQFRDGLFEAMAHRFAIDPTMAAWGEENRDWGGAFAEVFNQAAKWQSMSAGLLKMPLVMRVSVGNKYGAQHSQDWSALVHHIPGLKVYFPTTPTDAKGMLNLALSGTDPVVFLESQLLYAVSY